MATEIIDTEERAPGRYAAASRGILVAVLDTQEPLVDFPGNPGTVALNAYSTVAVTPDDVGKEAILLFEDGDPTRPILIGLLQPVAQRPKNQLTSITLDGKKATVCAEEEIVLRCGDASITLTRAGKVLIRGKYVLSRSSGVNMIKGAIVHVN
jgi:hypothetical protein